ncbi:MAG: ABC transporter permease subunit/CPBP intramembrane protease [Deltaproteobacteria bacterium]|nr:ABC transporter permease subunit/CPBP intramembrane protease [Deltaproteobacteria bacterium]
MKRRLQHILLVYAKELKETLRDRRTLAVMVLFPVVVYPLLSLVVGQVIVDRESRYEERPINVGATPGSAASTELQSPTAKAALKLNYRADANHTDVATRKIDLFVEQHTGRTAPPQPLRLVFDGSREESLRAQTRVGEYLRERLVPGSEHQYKVSEQDIGTAVSRGGYLLSKVVPLLVVLMVILGAFYPAIDCTAGERERGTLETTLVMPIKRVDLLAGKVLSVATLALLTGLLNLASLSLTFVQLARSADVSSLPLPWARLGAAALVLVPGAIMFGAVMLMAATAAKSFKEAQNFLTPIYFAFFGPAVAASLGEFPLTIGWAFVPGLNITLLTRDLILGEARLLPAVCFFISTAAVTALALAIAARLFDSERLLAIATREGTKRSWLLKGPAGEALGAGDAAVAFSLAVVVFWIFAPLAQKHLLLGTLVSQWGGMFAFAGLYVWLRRLPPAQTLGYERPLKRYWLAAVLLGAGGWLIVGLLTQWVAPPGPEVTTSLRTMLNSLSPPLALFLFALTPAVCEEALFRGLLLRALLNRFPPALAIVTVSLLFGIFHFSADRLLPTATLGILLALLAWRSGSLWPSMLVHALNNGILTLLAATGQDEAFERLSGPGQTAAVAGACVCVLAGLALLWRPRPFV